MALRRPVAALTLSLAFLAAVPAGAQTSGAALLRPMEPRPPAAANRNALPDFTVPEGDLRQAGDIRRNGLIAAYRLGPNVQIGVGRFSVPELARPRTNMERERNPTAVRPRDRGIAAVGFSLSF